MLSIPFPIISKEYIKFWLMILLISALLLLARLRDNTHKQVCGCSAHTNSVGLFLVTVHTPNKVYRMISINDIR
jgi:hypothetical protein